MERFFVPDFDDVVWKMAWAKACEANKNDRGRALAALIYAAAMHFDETSPRDDFLASLYPGIYLIGGAHSDASDDDDDAGPLTLEEEVDRILRQPRLREIFGSLASALCECHSFFRESQDLLHSSSILGSQSPAS
jgi:hypothetical protein